MVLGMDMGPTVQVDIVLVQHLLNFWDEEGIDVSPILVVLGMSDAGPMPPWVSADKLRSAQDHITGLNKEYGLGLKAGRYLAERQLPMAELIHCAENLAQGVPAAMRFVHRSVGLARVELQAVELGVELVPYALDVPDLSDYEEQQTLAALASLCRNVLSEYDERDVVLVLRDETVTDSAQALLGLPVESGPKSVVRISDTAWQRLNPAHQHLVFSNTLRELERKEKKLLEHLALYSELQEIIEACLLRRHVAQEDVAGQLGISVRNLQRRLKALGTTYQMLLDECRQTLAMKVIRDQSIPLYEIAYMVGYAEPSAFYKAFRRWTGSTPGEYRQAQSGEVSSV